MNKSDIHEECKGCKKCVGTTRPYYKNEDGIIKECPCAKCLVKGICKFSCEPYNAYIEAYHYHTSHMKNKIKYNQYHQLR